MRQGWCIGLRLPVQLRANNQKVDIVAIITIMIKDLSFFLVTYANAFLIISYPPIQQPVISYP